MPEIKTKIVNKNGMHMRPAMMVVDKASTFESDIEISTDHSVADAKSIMELTMLAAVKGTKIKIKATGKDADIAVRDIHALFESGFNGG
jgi:phosphotransferase system HPr (HPr) family protein